MPTDVIDMKPAPPKPLEQEQPASKRTRGRPSLTETVGTEALLKSARRTFARQGFEASSMRAIARDAGVDATLVSHHFGSKQALWEAAVNQIAVEAHKVAEETRLLWACELSPRERIEKAMAGMVERAFKDPDIGLFFSTAAVESGERLDFLIEQLVRPYHETLIPLISSAMDAGQMTRNDPDVVFWIVMGGIYRTVSYSHIVSRFTSLPESREAYQEAVLKAAISMLN